ncbi:MBL fold metallo-hydrolase, partial [Paenarthrobacter aurescens]|nr:MBL fold metallo-hydrolase [Paenarthrobacter aurescens]
IWIDPFLKGNKHTDIKPQDVKADVILLTHGHGDHLGDTIEIAKNNDALVVAPNELAVYLSWQGVKTHPLHIGGGREFEFGKVKLTQAFHGSA